MFVILDTRCFRTFPEQKVGMWSRVLPTYAESRFRTMRYMYTSASDQTSTQGINFVPLKYLREADRTSSRIQCPVSRYEQVEQVQQIGMIIISTRNGMLITTLERIGRGSVSAPINGIINQ